jgi:hypothetical protein
MSVQNSLFDRFCDFIGDVAFALCEKIAPGKTLPHERDQVILEGPRDAVRKMRQADRKIGRIQRAFNKARLPEDKIDAIRDIIKNNLDVAPHLAGQRRPSEDGRPLNAVFLTYAHRFYNENGLPIEQPIITVRIGKMDHTDAPRPGRSRSRHYFR